MIKYSIGITTFSSRLNFVSELIKDIRSFTELKILLCINGEKNGEFNENYRKKILQICLTYNNIYPIFFTEIRGLSKMWNTLVIHSDDDNILMLNDDLKINKDTIFRKVEHVITDPRYTGIVKINDSFSHFIINKVILHKLGYFDERLLGFGEEDGDILFRSETSGIPVGKIYVEGVINIISNVRNENIKNGIGKYSKFNREFVYNEKYTSNTDSTYRGMFDYPMQKVVEDLPQYTYEAFFRKNKHKLFK